MPRYQRQKALLEIGPHGQTLLAKAKVAVIGCGGLGSIALPYLAGAGVGHLVLIDGDRPEISNLHRQVFFSSSETKTKASALAEHIKLLNPEIKLTVFEEMIDKSNVEHCLRDCDIVLECTDDMMTKYLVNDYCHINKLPLVYGAIYKLEGYLSLFPNDTNDAIHLRDIFPEPDLTVPTCSEVGVIGTIAGLIGLMQANEAIKYIVGLEDLRGQLLTYNILNSSQYKLKLKKTWRGDINKRFANETYKMSSCEIIPEIAIAEVLGDIDRYKVVSILENEEHRAINTHVAHSPLSTFDIGKWIELNLENDKPSVFYCMTGKRSRVLVGRILGIAPEAKVYSLKGGLTTVPDNDF